MVTVIASAELITGWRETFSIEVAGELAGIERFELRQCPRCHVQFFWPPAAGSEELYQALQHFDWYYMPRKWEHDVALGDIAPGDRVLEVGCGRGDFIERILSARSAEVLGIELNSSAVDEARRLGRPVRNAHLADVAHEERAGFDVVCSFQVLEHVADPHTFLRDSVRLLRPGGRLLLGLPSADSFLKYQWNVLDMPPHHVTRWPKQALISLASTLGLRLERLAKEPLAKYHVSAYVDALAWEARPRLYGRLVGNRVSMMLLKLLLFNTPIRPLLAGQTVYGCYSAA